MQNFDKERDAMQPFKESDQFVKPNWLDWIWKSKLNAQQERVK